MTEPAPGRVPLVQPALTLLIRGATDRDGVLARIAQAAAADAPGTPPARLLSALVERERRMPTATPDGVAFPHALLPEVRKTIVVAARIDPPVPFAGKGARPVELALATLGPAEAPKDHLRTLSLLARLARAPGLIQAVRESTDHASVCSALAAGEATL